MLSQLSTDLLELISSYNVDIYHTLCLVFKSLNAVDVRIRMRKKFLCKYKLTFTYETPKHDLYLVSGTSDFESVIKFLYFNCKLRLRVWESITIYYGNSKIIKGDQGSTILKFDGCLYNLTTGTNYMEKFCRKCKPDLREVDLQEVVDIKDISYQFFRTLILLLLTGELCDEYSNPFMEFYWYPDSIEPFSVLAQKHRVDIEGYIQVGDSDCYCTYYETCEKCFKLKQWHIPFFKECSVCKNYVCELCGYCNLNCN